MKNFKQFAWILAIVIGGVVCAADNSFRAHGQPVIRMDNCPHPYQPVCARSRKRVLVTFANACIARASLARIVSDGACPQDCPSVYKPVCARDVNDKRRTFMNACAANNANAKILRNTRCLVRSS